MPSKTPAQAKLMRAAAATPGGYGGVPQSVGKEFVQADKMKAGAVPPHHGRGRRGGHVMRRGGDA